MKLSSRVGRIGESATLAVSSRAKQLAAEGIEVIDLSAGEPDFDSPPDAVAAAVEALESGRTKYTAAAGIPELRHALARDYERRYDAPWEAAQFVVTVGGKTALFELALALFEDGDEVVLPSPYWVTFPEQLRLAGASPVLVETRAEDAFRVDADAVLGALGPATRAVILNSPSNPTGSVIAQADLLAIVEACAERRILVIADETYERFVYDETPFPSAVPLARDYPETVVLVGSFSKTYAMTGWRIGYTAGPREVSQAVARIQSHATSNPTTFAMFGALAALERSAEAVAAMQAEYAERRRMVVESLDGIDGFECRPPAGAFYAFPKVSACYRRSTDGAGSVEFCRELLEEARVATVPGIAFGADEFIRISFACSRSALARGLERLGRFAAERVATTASR